MTYCTQFVKKTKQLNNIKIRNQKIQTQKGKLIELT